MNDEIRTVCQQPYGRGNFLNFCLSRPKAGFQASSHADSSHFGFEKNLKQRNVNFLKFRGLFSRPRCNLKSFRKDMAKSNDPPNLYVSKLNRKFEISESPKFWKNTKNHGFSLFKIRLLPVNPEKCHFLSTFFKNLQKNMFFESNMKNTTQKTLFSKRKTMISP